MAATGGFRRCFGVMCHTTSKSPMRACDARLHPAPPGAAFGQGEVSQPDATKPLDLQLSCRRPSSRQPFCLGSVSYSLASYSPGTFFPAQQPLATLLSIQFCRHPLKDSKQPNVSVGTVGIRMGANVQTPFSVSVFGGPKTSIIKVIALV